ncbi:hypothetical protein VitviT2T_027208 [Vitis vinifera]|uniref:Signal peptidase complex-like protein DTM1 n=1 Tax=Vitis vinifera TaxID=29760 RepID=A0ABY9DQ83_VITVI|nr:signal peptidase complex-like protein DTM1 [Vitis vinifera]WKA09577.1 hypothetical protein VitviT2T_027208 [Vitis vinifera]|eukprot:XP_002284147.1 PREDICTED: signal peptidase complex-like protein DTM1 [Vitis vinifera]
MADDALLRSSLIWLAAVIVLVGLHTHSFKKMMVTYLMGLFAIAGILLPHWDFFDRPFSQWLSPFSVDAMDSNPPHRSTSKRFRIYPLRLVIYAAVYGFSVYKWWMFVSN